MAEANRIDCIGASISPDSIKVIVEGAGMDKLPDGITKYLADDITFHLKHFILDASKFMRRSRRTKLINSDLDDALMLKKFEPQNPIEPLPLPITSLRVREQNYIKIKRADLQKLVENVDSNMPPEITFRVDWLDPSGEQVTIPTKVATIPKNEAPVTMEIQTWELVDSINEQGFSLPGTSKQTLRKVETIQIKQYAKHNLPAEKQFYYKKITEACVGSDEDKRMEAFQTLANDTGLYEMFPMISTFIAEGVQANVVDNNLSNLIYLMKMVKALLDNKNLYIKNCLHELIPSVITCIVSKTLSSRPSLENHWILRDFSSQLLARICKRFSNSTNNIQTRVTKIFADALEQGETLPLPSLYGVLKGLSQLGPEAIKIFILRRIKSIGARIEKHLEGCLVSRSDRNSSGFIKQLLLNVLVPIIKDIRKSPDCLNEYNTDYGYLGVALQAAVIRARIPPATTTTFSSTVAESNVMDQIPPMNVTDPTRGVIASAKESKKPQASSNKNQQQSQPGPSKPHVVLRSILKSKNTATDQKSVSTSKKKCSFADANCSTSKQN